MAGAGHVACLDFLARPRVENDGGVNTQWWEGGRDKEALSN